jgi:hypothetical protein
LIPGSGKKFFSSPAFQNLSGDLPDFYSTNSKGSSYDIRGLKLTTERSYVAEVKKEWSYTSITP